MSASDRVKRRLERADAFTRIADKFSDDEIKGSAEVRLFCDALLTETGGNVIVDFLDMGSWDCIEGYEFVEEKGHLFFNWHDFRGEENVKPSRIRQLHRLMFPASLYRLFVHLQSIRILRGKHYPMFLLQGYALTDKQIRRALTPQVDEHRFESDTGFSKVLLTRMNNQVYLTWCLNTPIYSIAIIPKSSGLNSRDSKFILYTYNVGLAIERLLEAQKRIDAIPKDDADQICEKANTVRRTLEGVLKLECCYREITFDKSYSQIRLGDLLSALKSFQEPSIKVVSGKVAEWANELSHDSGVPVEKSKLEILCAAALMYASLLENELSIEFHMPPHLRAKRLIE